MNRMEERRETYLQNLVNRATGVSKSSVSSPQSTVFSRQSSVGSLQSATYATSFAKLQRSLKATVAESSQQSATYATSFAKLQRSLKATVAESSQQTAVGQGEAGQSETTRAAGQKKQGKKAKGGVFKGLISGTIISESLILKDIRYTALIASLAIIFIANKFNAEKVERQIIVLEQEARDMRAESLSVSAELGSVSRQSEITDLVKERGLGLEELREPPYRIVVNE